MKSPLKLLASLWLVGLFVSISLFYIFVGGIEQIPMDSTKALMSPAVSDAILGRDSLGRSMLLLLLDGARTSLILGLLGSLGASFLGLILGAIAAWRRGLIEIILVRFVDVYSAIPGFLISAVICLGFQISFSKINPWFLLILSLVLTHWMGVFRLAKDLIIEAKIQDWVLAAQALGASPSRIVRVHIWPNIRGSIVLLAALQIPSFILYESYLSFIGIGLSSPANSWGLLIKEGWKSLSDFPHLMLAPSAFLFFTIWSIHQLAARSEDL